MSASPRQLQLNRHVANLIRCRRCPRVVPPPVSGGPVFGKIMIIGQAPGIREPVLARPFAHTAGKTLFRWFEQFCGLNEDAVRSTMYFAAVIRCFPGKVKGGTDRIPAPDEIDNCSPWMKSEFEILRPTLVIPVGRLAIGRFISFDKLDGVIGKKFHIKRANRTVDLIPLPHPSGASPWPKLSPGKELLQSAFKLIARHPAIRELKKTNQENRKRAKQSS